MNRVAPDRRLVLLAAPSVALTACSNIIGPPPSSQIYFLRAPAAAADAGANVGWTLAIARPNAPGSLDSDQILLARNDTEFDYYANAVWADRVPDLVQTSLLAGFEAARRINNVVRDEGLAHVDYRLLTDIRDFEARYTGTGANPVVVVTVVAHVASVHSHKLVSSSSHTSTQTCSENSVKAVVKAFDVALAAVVSGVVNWAVKLSGPV